MHQATEDPGASEPFQVGTRLAQSEPHESHLAHSEALTHEMVERHPACDDVPAGRSRLKSNPMVALQRLNRLKLDQRDLATRPGRSGVRAHSQAVPVSFKPLSGQCPNLRHRGHETGRSLCYADCGNST